MAGTVPERPWITIELTKVGFRWQIVNFDIISSQGNRYHIPRSSLHSAAKPEVFAAAVAILQLRSASGTPAILDARNGPEEHHFVNSLRNVYYANAKWQNILFPAKQGWVSDQTPISDFISIAGDKQHRTAQFCAENVASFFSWRYGGSNADTTVLAAFIKEVSGITFATKGRSKRAPRNVDASRRMLAIEVPDLGGTWYSCWQTSVEHRENINTEELELQQQGKKITIKNLERSPQNSLGGYLWTGELLLYESRILVGSYRSREANKVCTGTLYFLLNRNTTFMNGRWVGCNYDSDFISGYGVLARDLKTAKRKLRELLTTRPDESFKARKKHD